MAKQKASAYHNCRMRHSIFMALALSCAWLPAGAVEPMALPVVHTWGDLQKAPKLTVTPVIGVKPAEIASKSATFQVGLSSDKTGPYGAVLLYFLGETGSKFPHSPEDWGDYRVRIDGKLSEFEPFDFEGSLPWVTPPGAVFYAEPLPFLVAGDHIVELVKPAKSEAKSEALARATVHVEGAPEPAWSPFWSTQGAVSGGARSTRDALGNMHAIVPVNNPEGGAYLPKTPLPHLYASLPPPDFPLPQLLPHEEPGTHVALKMNGTALSVTLDSQIEGFFPDDSFLTCWWVNGRPVELDRTAARPGQMRLLHSPPAHAPFQFAAFHGLSRLPGLNVATIVWYTSMIDFNLAFKPEWLKAKKGDRIGVQVLFCTDGFFPLGGERDYGFPTETTGKNTTLPPSAYSQLSNKVEFIYSGDPANPAAP